ncbi:MAG: glycosyl hydrolase family 28-related protein, partial [Mucilaginibacter sp.]
MKYFFKTSIAVLLSGFISLAVSAQIKIYNIKHYGALGDSKTNNTTAIQKAIDEASANGGGRVLVPAGKFVTGVLTLKSNVDLRVDKGAVLLGSAIRADYGEGKAS